MGKNKDNKMIMNNHLKQIIEIICNDYHTNICNGLAQYPVLAEISDIEDMSEKIKDELIKKYKLALVVK